ncbi:MAG: hypothetical protein IME99_06520 [Proteobacteria bacterium]|nr:hypothetical protein [Pseudomonadota bacterium]
MAEHHGPTGPITDKMIVGDIIHTCPQAEVIIKKHLGRAALFMPGSRAESIEFLAAMNDYHVHLILDELNEICYVAPEKIGHF